MAASCPYTWNVNGVLMRKRLFTSILAVVFALSMTFTGTVAVFAEDAADTTDTTIVETEGSVSADDITLAAEEDIAEEDVTVAELEIVEEEADLVTEGEEEPAIVKIGDNGYDTLAEAVAAAQSGDTIEVVEDHTSKGFSVNSKTITVKGTGTVTLTSGINVTSGAVLNVDGLTINASGSGDAFQFSGNGTLNYTNGTLNISGFASAFSSYARTSADVCVINLIDTNVSATGCSSTAVFLDQNTARYARQEFNVIGQSKRVALNISSNGSRGLTYGGSTSYVNISNCDANINGNKSNASNGAHWTITNSTVNVNGNGGHGLSVLNLTIQNSVVTANNNGYTGVHVNGNLDVDNSVITIKGNSAKDWGDDTFSGLRLAGAGNASVDAASVLDIEDNHAVGLRATTANANVVIEGALTIVNNGKVKGSYQNVYGGGICTKANVTVPASAKIYNNHAKTAGDDIYAYAGASIAFGPVGTDWVLDDCECPITGWFYDGYRAEDAADDDTPLPKATSGVDETRWSVKGCELPDGTTAESTYAIEFTPAESNAGILALKAAHGVYRVSYHDNVEGTVFDDQNNNDLNYGDTTPEFQGEPTRDGYEFIGWTDEEGGDVVIELPSTVVGDADYYAVWKKIPATNPDEPGKPGTGSKTPGTSDMTDLMGYISLMGASILGIYVMVARRRKENA